MADEEATIGKEEKGDLGPHRIGSSSPIVIDPEKLADQVARLMRDELRLEMARGESMARRGAG